MKIHSITYGDSRFREQREFFRESALASSFFDEVKVFTHENLDSHFQEKFHEILQFPRGGGYMIWKPYIVKHMLETIEDNDILIYCDAGCMINSLGKKRFDQYIDIVNESETGTLAFQLSQKEYEYTKREVFEYFRSSEEIINSGQLITTAFLFKKCAHAKLLIGKWFNTVLDDAWLFTDRKTPPQLNGFIDHRHDQSIFSIVLKTYGAEILPDETYFQDFVREGNSFPFWAVRLGHT
ncbi:hypothetical protein [Pedobacter sp. L105]|uniref:hypothetical protein n=1 Tax=Pedobacter sp. L105 TaxID=1641871 RepID=UPI00131BF647|nr:hypothetical protein [Pedobacter sp. L105]